MTNNKLYSISTDIILVLTTSKKIGWEYITAQTIKRILYLASVIYCFANDGDNIFENDYSFIRTVAGPDCIEIENAIIFLQKDKFIVKDTMLKGYILGQNQAENIEKLPDYSLKKEWIETIILILATYGEDKLYDFIFRDPEYQNNVEANSTYPIAIDESNATVKLLNEFKTEFEKSIANSQDISSKNVYIKLYFEYIFSNIVRRS